MSGLPLATLPPRPAAEERDYRDRREAAGGSSGRARWTAVAPPAVLAIGLGLPVLVGLAGVALPAVGWLPAIGARTLTLGPFRDLLAQPGLSRSIGLSLLCGLAGTLLALAIVFLFLAAFSHRPWFQRACRLLSPLLSIPHAAAAFGLVFLIAPSGWLVRLTSPWLTGWTRPPDLLIVNDPMGLSLLAALVAKEVPFLLLMSLAALPQTGATQRVAVARSLGYGPATAWLKAVAPALYPLVRLPVFAVAAYATAVVDMAVIAGPANPPPLGVLVLRWQTDPDLAMRLVAAAGSVLLVAVTALALVLWVLGERLAGALAPLLLLDGRRCWAELLARVAGGGGMGAAALALVAGLLLLALWSVAGSWPFTSDVPVLSAANWLQAAPALPGPFAASALIGAVSVAIAALAVVAVLESDAQTGRTPGPARLALLYAPLVVPPVSFLFGLAIASEAAGWRPGLTLVITGHVLFVLPYVYLSLSEAYRRLDPRLAALARTLGARPAAVFLRVRLPLLLTPLATALAVGFAVSAGQYLATQVLGAGRVPTVTTEAVALAAGGDRRVIGVWALTQALLPMLGFALALSVPRLVWRNRRGMRQ